MKLLFSLQNFPPSEFGGISSSVYELVIKLAEHHDVFVLTTTNKITPDSFLKIKYDTWTVLNGVNIKYVKTNFSLVSIKYIFSGLKEIRDSDQVHLHSLFFSPNFLFSLYSIFLRKTTIWSTHGELSDAALKIKWLKKKLYLLLLRINSKNIVFRATSDLELSQIKKNIKTRKIITIPNIFDTQLTFPACKKNQILYLGRICPIKKIENLIIACSKSEIFEKVKTILIIAGPVDKEHQKYLAKLHRLIDKLNLSKQVAFLSVLHSPDKERIISQSKILCLISDSESFGIAILEALSLGTPVIASKGTPWEEVEIYQCGLWIDNSPSEISKAIDKVLTKDESSYLQMCNNAKALAKKYSSNNIINQWLDLISGNYSFDKLPSK
jgi:glycosyltransferase involved in cell wall biosynthesis